MATNLRNNKPGKVYLQNIHNTSLIHLLHQNNAQKSRQALQRVRTEDKNVIEQDKDVFKDLDLFAKETESQNMGEKVKGFVHVRQFDQQNIQVHLYTQASLQMLVTCQKSGNAILNFDATGSIIQSVNSKRLLYYLGMVNTNEGYSFPLASTISYRGRSFEVSDLFRKIACELRTLYPNYNKPLVPIAVCDYSPAVISGLLEGINTMQINDYIKMCYEVIDDKKKFETKRSIVFVCTSHVIRSFTRLVGKHLPSTPQNRRVKRLASQSLARLQQTLDINSFVVTCKRIYETFGMERMPEDIIEGNTDLLNCKEYENENLATTENIDITFEDYDEEEGLREGSPFYKIFSSVEENVWDEHLTFDTEVPLNPYYCPKVVELIKKYYVPYAPLWCSMILYKTQRHTHGSISNALVEAEFNFIKNNFHNLGPEKLNIFVRRHYEYYSGKIKHLFSVAATMSQNQNQPKKRLQKTSSQNQSISQLSADSQPVSTYSKNNSSSTADLPTSHVQNLSSTPASKIPPPISSEVTNENIQNPLSQSSKNSKLIDHDQTVSPEQEEFSGGEQEPEENWMNTKKKKPTIYITTESLPFTTKDSTKKTENHYQDINSKVDDICAKIKQG